MLITHSWVAELFEARKPKDHAIIAEMDGRVEFGKDYKAKRRVIVKNDETGEDTEYLIPKGKHVSVQEGDFVRRGDPLVDGPRVPHDILKVLGVEALSDYLVNEIQDVYRLQGVKINGPVFSSPLNSILNSAIICRMALSISQRGLADPGPQTHCPSPFQRRRGR